MQADPDRHRDRQIGEHPPRRMQRQTLVRVQQRVGDPATSPVSSATSRNKPPGM